MKHRESFGSWKTEWNPTRAGLEKKHGYDRNHAMHLNRLMRTGLELPRTGELHVRRPDASKLNAVRDGQLSYEELLASAAELGSALPALRGRCTLTP